MVFSASELQDIARNPEHRNGLKRLALIVFLAGVCNIGWGALVVAYPERMLAGYGILSIQWPQFWRCIGMFVGVFGVGYLIASRNLHRYWPVILVGLLGKLLGSIRDGLGAAAGPSSAWFPLGERHKRPHLDPAFCRRSSHRSLDGRSHDREPAVFGTDSVSTSAGSQVHSNDASVEAVSFGSPECPRRG